MNAIEPFRACSEPIRATSQTSPSARSAISPGDANGVSAIGISSRAASERATLGARPVGALASSRPETSRVLPRLIAERRTPSGARRRRMDVRSNCCIHESSILTFATAPQRPCQSWRLQVVCCGPPAPVVGILWTDIARVDAAEEVVAAPSRRRTLCGAARRHYFTTLLVLHLAIGTNNTLFSMRFVSNVFFGK